MPQYLFDTDVIIDYLRGVDQAVKFFETFDSGFTTSAVTVAELYTGVKGNAEQHDLAFFLSLFTVFPLTEEIAIEAGSMRRTYFKSHGMGLADAMIAATAKAHELTLISLNSRHFSMLDNLSVPYKK